MAKREIKLSQTLKSLMQKRDISARKLASVCKIPQSSLSGILSSKNGRTDPVYLDSLATYFGVTIEFLLFGSDSQLAKIQNLRTEKLFKGFLKVNIERVIADEEFE